MLSILFLIVSAVLVLVAVVLPFVVGRDRGVYMNLSAREARDSKYVTILAMLYMLALTSLLVAAVFAERGL